MSRRLALPLPLLLAVAACSVPPPPTGQQRADAATLAACRTQADAMYDRQNRDTIYTITSRDTPYSANYTPGVVDRGLAQRFGRENMVRDCVRNTGTEADRTTPPPAEPPKP